MNEKFDGRTELKERTEGERRAVGALRCTRRSTWSAATWVARWQGRLGRSSDRGMTTSEYAVGTIAACAFAAVLYKVVNSGPVMSAMQSMIEGALDAKF
ncbi:MULTISPECIES: DUF4244 domain-containing protein [unclassified Streptomyces]|uniref:DUF4244 domain-containing protein n=1 Tax=unclassified Streptomyces TaxID=2593676 RepID=UPI001F1B09A9|nr:MULTISPECIES: DUF4244 domain-containing protein [unclassified Streptomyces]